MNSSLKITVPPVSFTFDKRQLRRTLLSAGQEVAAVARSLIRGAAANGRKYGKHRASAPGQPPASLSGGLAASIKASMFRNGKVVSIRESKFYALFLEKGAEGGGGATRTGGYRRDKNGPGKRLKRTRIAPGRYRVVTARILAPRPALSTAMDERRGSIEARIKAAVIDGIKFQRVAANRRL